MALFDGWSGKFTAMSIELDSGRAHISVKAMDIKSYHGALDVAATLMGLAETLWGAPKEDAAPAASAEAPPTETPPQ